MKQKLTKSDFLMYLDSPMHLWAFKNNCFDTSKTEYELHLIKQGYEVEKYAKQYLELVISNMPECKLIWQNTYDDENYQLKIDALVFNSKNQSYDLYEIKSSTKVKPEHYNDVTFQFLVLSELLPIDKVYVLHLKKDYIRKGSLDISQLFVASDVTEKVFELKESIDSKRRDALALLQQKTPEGLPPCLKPSECPCLELCHPVLPDFSIHDVPRLNSAKKELLRNNNILDVKDIPDDFPLSENQSIIVSAAKKGTPSISIEKLSKELNKLTFPLYFLDYETFNSALPLFDGYNPQQQIVFQYSLHVLESFEEAVKHYEYLALDKNDPGVGLIESLKKHIGPTGSILVWNKTFEESRNKEMANRYPQHADFLNSINNRIYDLANPVNKGIYVHPGFKGSWSIKNVLPVLVPNLTYKTLEIQKGDEAMHAWWKLTHGNSNENSSQEQRTLAQSLLDYCKLDTLAMVEIWKKFNDVQNG